MDTTRQQKIARMLQKELSEIFLGIAHRIPGTMITVTNVRITPDLSIARVYLSIFPGEKTDSTLEFIKEQTKTIRYELGLKVRHQLRIIPELSFYIDDSLDYIDNIDRLLHND
jgi:ribosome-binding factor A